MWGRAVTPFAFAVFGTAFHDITTEIAKRPLVPESHVSGAASNWSTPTAMHVHRHKSGGEPPPSLAKISCLIPGQPLLPVWPVPDPPVPELAFPDCPVPEGVASALALPSWTPAFRFSSPP